MAAFAILYWAAFLAAILAVLVVGVCVIWAPVAAAICWAVAKHKELDAKRSAVIGGAFSVLLFFPWLYFLLQMLNIRVPRALIGMTYAVLYSGWLLSAIGVAFSTSARIEPSLISELGLPLLGINLITWLASLLWLKAHSHGYSAYSDLLPYDIVPRFGYIMPFGLAAMWTVYYYLALWHF